jgi:two-component system, NtrC family, response regulator AtoC
VRAALQWSVATPTTLLNASTLAGSQAGTTAGLHLLVMGPKQFATFALPACGEVTVGRGGGAAVDVKLDDAKASRRHLRFYLGDDIEVEDLGSANGTRVRGEKLPQRTRIRVLPGEAISIGSLVLMVQPNGRLQSQAPAPGRLHRLWIRPAFEGYVEWECTRAEATGGTFSIARLPALPDGEPDASLLRRMDIIGRTNDSDYGLLARGLTGHAARSLFAAFMQSLGAAEQAERVGIASYPDDGRNAGALMACASARARRPRGGSDRQPAGDGAADPVVCVDAGMVRVQALAERAAAGDINLLIQGETGVGKEVLARAIHAASARASRPLVSINCAAVPDSLLNAELFGYERGAFTGAVQAKPGLLETAPGGTVFLDEIGELPLPDQASFLRVIETREIWRIGSMRPRKIDVRFICATNRDLEAEVLRRGFRQDLYYRLNGMTLTIPALRERPRDLPLLARAFVTSLARGRAPAISDAAMATLQAHGWPGNVRELRNAIERALMLCDGPTILPEHLPRPVPFAPTDASVAFEPPAVPPPAPSAPAGDVDDEHARILAALAECGGNQSRAARQLGISRKVLIARLDRYGVRRPRKPGAK